MKLKGSLNYHGETTPYHHLDAAREILRDQFHVKIFYKS